MKAERAKKFPPEVIGLFDRSLHGGLGRRAFLDATGKYALGALTAAGMLGNVQLSEAMTPGAAQKQPGSNATSQISRFVVKARYDALPLKALEWAKTAVLDCLGTALAGSREESGRIVAALAREEKAKEEASVYGQGFKSSVIQAAYVNGIAAHATDFDHSFVIGGQPTAPIIPAVFALGESLDVSGKQVLEAYAAGFEVATALVFGAQAAGRGAGPAGAFGATAACSKLLGLTESEIEAALGITFTMVSGGGFAVGTMGKPLSVGLAARAGVLAPKMAKAGFAAGTPELAPLEELGKVYSLEKYGIRLKPYPCGGLTHSAIYATIQLRNQHAIQPGMVEHIEVAVPQGTANTISYRVPQTGLQGKFCMGYLVARALIDGKLTLDAFTDMAVRDKEVLSLVEKVEMRVDPNLPSSASADGSRPATVTIKLKNGQTQMLYQRFPKGSPQVPMTQEELKDKFQSCVRGVITDALTQRAIEYVVNLETMDRLSRLTDILRGSRS